MDNQDTEVLIKVGNIGSGEAPSSEPDILTLAARQALGEEKEKVEIDNIKAALILNTHEFSGFITQLFCVRRND
ncbi:MAG: hypothetical protein HKM04_03310 [Legionellales bacterium]|nr:hypothetical protein [Legionellales bacterium]